MQYDAVEATSERGHINTQGRTLSLELGRRPMIHICEWTRMRHTTDTWPSAGVSLAKNIFGLLAR